MTSNSHRPLLISVSLSECHPQQCVSVRGSWWLTSSWSRKGEKSAVVISCTRQLISISETKKAHIWQTALVLDWPWLRKWSLLGVKSQIWRHYQCTQSVVLHWHFKCYMSMSIKEHCYENTRTITFTRESINLFETWKRRSVMSVAFFFFKYDTKWI